MLCILNTFTNPYFNIALEEYLLKNFDDDIFLLYRNEPSIVVGKHQNTLAEINLELVKDLNIKVVRRISGGGAVYHDEGNLNYTFIQTGEKEKLVDFKKYSTPVLEALLKLKLNAKFGERNEILVNSFKVGGTAEHIHKTRVLHHGTLLFSSDLEILIKTLNPDIKKYSDKAVKSIPGKVANISSFLRDKMNISTFTSYIFNQVLNRFTDSVIYKLNDNDIRQIKVLEKEKYNTWDWNYGYSPNYKFTRKISSEKGNFEISLNVENGIIHQVQIVSDIIDSFKLGQLGEILKYTFHNPVKIEEKLNLHTNLEIFNIIQPKELISWMF